MSKLAYIHEQSGFTHSGSLVAFFCWFGFGWWLGLRPSSLSLATG